jgi:fission process protein 1
MASREPKKDDFDPKVPHERNEPRPDFSQPLLKTKLPKALQETLDDDEKLWDVLYEGK